MPSFSISCLKTILSSSNPFYILNAIEQENGRKRSLRRSIVFAGRSVVYGMIFILCLASFSHRTWRPFELLLHFDTRTVLQKFGMSHFTLLIRSYDSTPKIRKIEVFKNSFFGQWQN